MLIRRVASIGAMFALWSLWALCVVLILPAMLSPPGDPGPGDVELYVAVLGAVTIYPVALPVLLLLKRWASSRNRSAIAATIRVVIGLAFLAVLVVLGMLAAGFHDHEQSRAVPTQAEIFSNAYSNAILSYDTKWIDEIIANGAGVDHPMRLGQTPAIKAAASGRWSIVLHLLERGADPDRKDDSAESIRTLAASPREQTQISDELRALDLVRNRLGLNRD